MQSRRRVDISLSKNGDLNWKMTQCDAQLSGASELCAATERLTLDEWFSEKDC